MVKLFLTCHRELEGVVDWVAVDNVDNVDNLNDLDAVAERRT